MSKDEIGRGNSIKIMLGGFAAGLALVRGYRPENPHYPDSRVKSSDKPIWYGTPREIVPIIDMPLRFDPDILRDTDHLLPPEYPIEFEPKTYLGDRWINVDNSDDWHEMRKRKLKLSHETAEFTSHTIPGYLPDIENDQDLMGLREIEDETQRFEQMLILMGIETQELNDPRFVITNPNIDPNARYCAAKLVEYLGIENRALQFDSQLTQLMRNEENLSEDVTEKIRKKSEELKSLYTMVSENFTTPMKDEYLLRVTRPYYSPSLDVWEYSRWEGMHDVAINNFPIIESDVRTRTLALVMHAHACIESFNSPEIQNSLSLKP